MTNRGFGKKRRSTVVGRESAFPSIPRLAFHAKFNAQHVLDIRVPRLRRQGYEVNKSSTIRRPAL
jgi:hypothetical protein